MRDFLHKVVCAIIISPYIAVMLLVTLSVLIGPLLMVIFMVIMGYFIVVIEWVKSTTTFYWLMYKWHIKRWWWSNRNNF